MKPGFFCNFKCASHLYRDRRTLSSALLSVVMQPQGSHGMLNENRGRLKHLSHTDLHLLHLNTEYLRCRWYRPCRSRFFKYFIWLSIFLPGCRKHAFLKTERMHAKRLDALRSSYTMRTKCAISDTFFRDWVFAYCASVAQYVYSLSAEHCFRLRNSAISDERVRYCGLCTHSVAWPLQYII